MAGNVSQICRARFISRNSIQTTLRLDLGISDSKTYNVDLSLY